MQEHKHIEAVAELCSEYSLLLCPSFKEFCQITVHFVQQLGPAVPAQEAAGQARGCMLIF